MNKPIFRSVLQQPVKTHQLRSGTPQSPSANKFSQHLQSALDTESKLTISKHANERLHQRGIQINDSRWKQIESKVQEAKKMGIKDSLVLLDNAALIVSVKNKTVITALNRQEASSQIFTNINGTIILD
jgi:flagellar operon protein